MESGCAFYYEGIDDKLIIPDGVKYIGDFAISSCEIKELVLPDSLEQIGIYAFRDCEHLEKLIIPNNVKLIGAGIFNGCPNLREFYLPEGAEMMAISESFIGSPNVTVYGYKNNRSMQYIHNELGVPCVFLD
ncbi:MAG: leucine-rich repeat domain-containing protein [Oscillospiraceae bacterium]|nr:leucine-rich repeat domain-containing protein [Oscillospiraceae bacterium]